MDLQRFIVTADYAVKYKKHFIHDLMEFGFGFWKGCPVFSNGKDQKPWIWISWSLEVFMFPSDLEEHVPSLICGASVLHRICGLLSHRQYLLQSLFPAALSDFITRQPRITQQTQTSNRQHLLHLPTSSSLLVQMSSFSGNE